MSFKKIPNGDYYHFNREGNTVIIIKHNQKRSKMGYVINDLVCPKELIGKRVRLKLEMVK